jgi:hypothetical protein
MSEQLRQLDLSQQSDYKFFVTFRDKMEKGLFTPKNLAGPTNYIHGPA